MTVAVQTDNPFPGLRPFEPDQADLFFGRDEQIEELLDRLEQHRFVAVVGTSGSGKSSLVRAGLIPALERGYIAGAGARWRTGIMRPGTDPIAELARCLCETFEAPDPESTATLLRRSSLGLAEFARQHLPSGESLLLVVDQFEELFRYRQEAEQRGDPETAAAFVKLLLAATGHSELPPPEWAELPIYVVLTMRSDFLGKCAQFQGLPEAMNDSQYLVPRLTREQQREAIEGPIGMAGARIAPPLVQRLLNDVGDNPDQLPVLQHALMRTWEQSAEARARRDPIDLPDYEAIGGMQGALDRDADQAFAALQGDPKDEAIAWRLFQRLTEPGAAEGETRRPTALSEIIAVTGASEMAVRRVIELFRSRGFLTLSADPDPIVDIAHESLIRLWGKLRRWVEEEAESARIYSRLAESAVERRPLYRDTDLTQAQRWKEQESPNAAWAQRYPPRDSSSFPAAMQFLERSKYEEDRQQQLQDRGRKLEESQRWFRRLIPILILVLAIVSALAIWAFSQRARADSQMRRANGQAQIARAQKANAVLQTRMARAEAKNAARQAHLAFLSAVEARRAQEQAETAQKQAETAKRIASREAARANAAALIAKRNEQQARKQEALAREAKAKALRAERNERNALHQEKLARRAAAAAKVQEQRSRGQARIGQIALMIQLGSLKQTGFADKLAKSATVHGLPASFLFAIASRETNCTNELGDRRADGFHGVGILQLDILYPIAREARDSGSWRSNPDPLIDFVAAALARNVEAVKVEFPSYTQQQYLKIAASAWNCGLPRAIRGQKLGDSDRFTTGRDYGRDVMTRMAFFDEHIGEK